MTLSTEAGMADALSLLFIGGGAVVFLACIVAQFMLARCVADECAEARRR